MAGRVFIVLQIIDNVASLDLVLLLHSFIVNFHLCNFERICPTAMKFKFKLHHLYLFPSSDLVRSPFISTFKLINRDLGALFRLVSHKKVVDSFPFGKFTLLFSFFKIFRLLSTRGFPKIERRKIFRHYSSKLCK